MLVPHTLNLQLGWQMEPLKWLSDYFSIRVNKSVPPIIGSIYPQITSCPEQCEPYFLNANRAQSELLYLPAIEVESSYTIYGAMFNLPSGSKALETESPVGWEEHFQCVHSIRQCWKNMRTATRTPSTSLELIRTLTSARGC